MSWPSKTIRPEVTSCSLATHRARVDLPHPVSPTTPNVCPRGTDKLTPSTACTYSLSWNSPLPLIGKYLTRFSTRSSTSSLPSAAAAGTGLVSLAGPVVIFASRFRRPGRLDQFDVRHLAADGFTVRLVVR